MSGPYRARTGLRRDVDAPERVLIAFPMTTSVSRLATDASSPVDAQQLKELHPHIQ